MRDGEDHASTYLDTNANSQQTYCCSCVDRCLKRLLLSSSLLVLAFYFRLVDHSDIKCSLVAALDECLGGNPDWKYPARALVDAWISAALPDQSPIHEQHSLGL
jgi:hypothetical protein